MRLGDEVFFRGLSQYVDKHKFGSVETADLRKSLEAASGLSLQRFFDQWCTRPGVPHVTASTQWDSGASELVVTLEQVQTIDPYNPAYAFEMPVWVKLPGEGEWRKLSARTETKASQTRLKLAAEPAAVVFDPELHVLAKLDVQQAEEHWLTELRDGPTFAARARAVDALRAAGGGALASHVADALVAVARDEGSAVGLRTAALAALGADERVMALAIDPPEDARVRRALVEAAGRLLKGREEASESLTGFLLRSAWADRSYGVRSEAITALANAGHAEAMAIALEATAMESQHDQVRQAALRALATLDKVEGLAAAIRLAGPGVNSRTRPVAVETVRTLAKHDEEAATDLLVHLLEDREARTVRAAGEVLASMGGERAAAALEAYASRARSAMEKKQAGEWVEKVGRKASAADAAR
jgi:aminopeptidase N